MVRSASALDSLVAVSAMWEIAGDRVDVAGARGSMFVRICDL